MKNLPKFKFKITITNLVLFFLGVHVITSQLSVALSSIGQGVMIGLVFISILINSEIFKSSLIIKQLKLLLYLSGLFILTQVISILLTANSFSSVISLKSNLLILTFFVPIIFIKDAEQLKNFLIALFIFSALVSILELIKYYNDYIYSFKELSTHRMEYFGYPITNAEIKMLILLIMSTFIITRNSVIMNWKYIVILGIPVFISFFLTFSRNAYLGLAAGWIILGFMKNKYFLASFVAAITLFLLFAPGFLKDRMISITDMNHPSNHARFLSWETGIKIFKDHPLTGIGDADFTKTYKQYKTPEIQGEGSHMHNNFMQILVTSGIAGVLSWSAFMIYIFIYQINIYKKIKDKFLRNLALCSLICMIAFQITGLTEWNFTDFEFAAVMWFSLSLAFIADKLNLSLSTEGR